MFKKVLIANRGEIACRIARTCHRLGIAVAGVHSSADRDALHVKFIGESIEIGGAPAAESYLRIDAVIDAAKRVGAEAIHPGFGFLAENAAFAAAVEKAGLVFVGPTAEIIDRLGDKAAAKREAKAAGVPTVPGSEVASDNIAEVAATVRGLKLPVMLKAAAGGGGKGMRAVTTLDGLEAEIESAMREAKNAFGSPGLIVEQMIQRARHIEVQIAGDGRGNVIHLFERECSLQRRHQKLVEEAPAANLSARVREHITGDAVRLGERLRYRGVGTVEFIVQGEDYYFLEVNPRLQVEHPVTEEVTGIDIVELMLRVAAGEGLPVTQDEVKVRGHAVEVRICAEDAASGFMPSTGRLSYVKFPEDGVRVETGIETGMEVTPYYDPMLAKLITCAETRDQALDRLVLALDEISVFGVITNRDFLKKLLNLPETRQSTFHTRLIDEQIDGWDLKSGAHRAESLAIAAYYWLTRQRTGYEGGIWSSLASTGWQFAAGGEGLAPIPTLHLQAGGTSAEIRFAPLKPDGSLLLAVGEQEIRLTLSSLGGEDYLCVIGDRREKVRVVQEGNMIFVQDHGGAHAFEAITYLAFISAAAEVSGELRAPMMGLILKVNVKIGDTVKAGDVVAVLESMKMEMRITAECDGTVTAVNCQSGQTVERNAVIVMLEPKK
mgnify:CR=1 FL=1